jgi:heme exporter protein B
VNPLLKRDLLLAYRRKGELLNPLFFFWIVVGLFPLSVAPDPQLLIAMGPGILWMAALLATLLGLDLLFRSDFEDGSLEQLLISPQSLLAWVLAKSVAHWLVTGLPLTLLAPILGLMVQIPIDQAPVVVSVLAIGTPILSLIGTIGAALTVGLKKGGLILPILVLPLYIPVLIFGSSIIVRSAQGMTIHQPFALLGALLALTLMLAPVMAAVALRVSLSR